MKKGKKKSGKQKPGRVKGKAFAGTTELPGVPDAHTGYGILPDRDLKKNLGCG
jgi:hypothetical protein